MRDIDITFDADGHVLVKKPSETIEMTPTEAREEANHYADQMRAELLDAASKADRLYDKRDPYT
jgi:hypothetical protein